MDTNVFLHLRDLKDLPWHDLWPNHDWIEIVVAHPVIEELDQKKVDRSNSRIRDRSRSALRMLKDAAKSPNHRLFLNNNPTLSIRPDSSHVLDWSAFPMLNQSNRDDRIVMATLHHTAPRALLTADGGPVIRAHLNGLDAVEPPEHWFLPIQKSEEKKEIERLRRELLEEKVKRPKLRVEFADETGKPGAQITLIIPKLKPFTGEQCTWLAREHAARNPRAELRSAIGTQTMLAIMASQNGYTQAQAARYHSDYDSYIDQLTDYFGRLHDGVRTRMIAREFSAKIKNESSHTAQKVIVTAVAPNEMEFIVEHDWPIESGPLTLPEPPDPPNQFPGGATWVDSIPFAAEANDPTAFTWQYGKPDHEHNCSLISEEIRARSMSIIDFWIFLRSEFGTCEIELTVSASNLPEPISAKAMITIETREAEWNDNILSVLDPHIADDIRRIT